MNTSLIQRNLTLFFRDRMGVFFSLLAVLIVIILYAVFLGDVWLTESLENIDGAATLMDTWLIAGLLAIASITTTLGAFSVMIDDRIKKINKDFYSSPVKRSNITFSYICSAFLIGVIMSCITVVVAQIYILMRGGDLFSAVSCVKTFLLILLASLASTSIVCFIVSFFKSQNAFNTASTILGVMIGFVTGIYLPVGALPGSAQTIMDVFPLSHAASLFRQTLMDGPMKNVFDGVPAETVQEFNEYMGVTLSIGSYEVTALVSVLILIATVIIFFGLSLWSMSRKIL